MNNNSVHQEFQVKHSHDCVKAQRSLSQSRIKRRETVTFNTYFCPDQNERCSAKKYVFVHVCPTDERLVG